VRHSAIATDVPIAATVCQDPIFRSLAMNSISVPHPRTVRFAERACGHDPIQRVLAVVDLRGVGRRALGKAARLAAAFGATLDLYACDDGGNLPANWAGGSTLAQYRSVLRERSLAMLEELAEPYRRIGLTISTTYECNANIDEALITHAIRSGASLVVKDAALASGTADHVLITQLPMPLLLVRTEPWGPHPRVATSIDPCRPCERPVGLDESVVGLGASISRALGGVSFAVHVLEGPPHLRDDVVTAGERQAAFERQRAQVLALPCLVSLDDREVRFAEGGAAEGIVHLTEETRPSILVMGVAARPRADDFGGGTATAVLRQTECDLLVVKPAGFVSLVMVTE
jgi:nucleotide-binding universal stress UspA family protein